MAFSSPSVSRSSSTATELTTTTETSQSSFSTRHEIVTVLGRDCGSFGSVKLKIFREALILIYELRVRGAQRSQLSNFLTQRCDVAFCGGRLSL